MTETTHTISQPTLLPVSGSSGLVSARLFPSVLLSGSSHRPSLSATEQGTGRQAPPGVSDRKWPNAKRLTYAISGEMTVGTKPPRQRRDDAWDKQDRRRYEKPLSSRRQAVGFGGKRSRVLRTRVLNAPYFTAGMLYRQKTGLSGVSPCAVIRLSVKYYSASDTGFLSAFFKGVEMTAFPRREKGSAPRTPHRPNSLL